MSADESNFSWSLMERTQTAFYTVVLVVHFQKQKNFICEASYHPVLCFDAPSSFELSWHLLFVLYSEQIVWKAATNLHLDFAFQHSLDE
jgi:hypothetical protein